jgi:hypothetical protein
MRKFCAILAVGAVAFCCSVSLAGAKEKTRDLKKSEYLSPALDMNNAYRFDENRRPLRGRDKKTAKDKKKGKKKDTRKNKWARQPGKRRPHEPAPKAAPPAEAAAGDSEDAEPEGGGGNGPESEPEAAGSPGAGGFNYGDVKVDEDQPVGISPAGGGNESGADEGVKFGAIPPQGD